MRSHEATPLATLPLFMLPEPVPLPPCATGLPDSPTRKSPETRVVTVPAHAVV